MTISSDRTGSAPTAPYLDTLVAAVYSTLRTLESPSAPATPDVAGLRERLRFGLTWWHSMLDVHQPVEHPSRGYVCPSCRTSVLRRPVRWPCAVWDRTAVHLATMTVLESRLGSSQKPLEANGKRVSVPLSQYRYLPRHLLAG
ncbi:hypothetical protein [Allokutzneria oryzae]|uniref:Transposase zinc-ribbon domain-containing protein n=1 Tax=Allokutzneria oryzae TaxID=1378989 RepID=A0ABV6A310_9PSEU